MVVRAHNNLLRSEMPVGLALCHQFPICKCQSPSMSGTKRPRNKYAADSTRRPFVKKKDNTDSFSLSLSQYNAQLLAASLASSSSITLNDELSLSSDHRRVKRLKLAAPPTLLSKAPLLPPSSNFDYNTTFVDDFPDWQDDAPVEDEDAEQDEDELEDGARKASRYASSVSSFIFLFLLVADGLTIR